MTAKANRTGKYQRPTRFFHNLRPAMLLILVPVIIGAIAIYYVLSGPLSAQLASFGSNRLITDNWQSAYANLANAQPEYGPKHGYYKLKEGQDIEWVARHFSVDSAKLKQLNPGKVVYGTTVAVPPVEKALQASKNSTSFKGATIREVEGLLHINNDFQNPLIRTTIPELGQFLASHKAITKVANKHYRINKPLVIENNIRLDITSDTVQKLELASSPNFGITCLCFENGEVLIKDTAITSVDPTTGKPDVHQEDGRSFVRALKSTRMDVINSDISYLGNGLLEGRQKRAILRDGATYGISWRITDDTLGSEIATGWVEGNTFHYNHFGAYTFGASGIMWRSNLFTKNEVYGLDPHDDSNNATVEHNRFIANGKHGFIVSKRCNYNLIRNNVSVNNALHGYMLHQDSNYNVIENNVAVGNTDNFVIYSSNLNAIRANKSYNSRSAHVRINVSAKQNYIQDNLFYGGEKGVYLYEGADGALIERNTFTQLEDAILATDQVSRAMFTGNNIESLHYEIEAGDRVVFGPNYIQDDPVVDLAPLRRQY